MNALPRGVDPDLWCAAFRALSSPLEYMDEATWADASLRALVDLVGSYGGMAVFVDPDGSRPYEVGVAPDALDAIHGPMLGLKAGRLRFEEPVLDQVMSRTMALGLRVYDMPYGEQVTGIPFRKISPFYHEVLKPYGLADFTLALTGSPQGQGFIGACFEDDEFGPLGSNGVRAALKQLLPALESGMATEVRLGARRRNLFGFHNRLDIPVAVYAVDGRLLHMNAAFQQLSKEAPDGADLTVTARRLAQQAGSPALGDLSAGTGAAKAVTCGPGGVRTLHASPVVSGTFDRRACVIITLDEGQVLIPKVDALRETYLLTSRQAEIARLLALGWSNARIAAQLRISPHTVRHHAEAVLERVGVHSRKALGIRMLADARRRSRLQE